MKKTISRHGLWIAALLLFVWLMAGCSARQVLPEGVSVEVEPRESGPRITVRAELHGDAVSQLKGESLYLFAIAPGQPVDTAGLSPVGECRVSGKMTYRLDDVAESALYSGYVLAQRRDDGSYRVMTNPVYLTNPEALGRAEKEARTSYPEMPSIKGLWFADPDAAAQTRADHTVLTLPLGDYLAFSGAEDTIRYHFDGITFYLRREAVLELDRRVRAMTDAGVHPYLCVVLRGMPSDAMPAGLRALYTDGAQLGAEGYAISFGDRESFMRIAGFFSFLADRYTRADGEYGFAGSFILGESVNRSRISYSGGARSLSAHAAEYAALLRVADTAVRSQFAEGRVYASFGGNYTAMSADPDAAADPLLDYAARDMLDALAAHLRSGGDIPWNVALSLTSSRKGDSVLWEDVLATADPDAAYVTPHNLSVLTDYLSDELLMWDGEMRRVVISDLRIASAGEDGPAKQAASYAYAYGRVLENGGIEAMIYRAEADEVTDNLGCGLYTAVNGRPAEPRRIYTNFAEIDCIGGTLMGTDLLGNLWDTLLPYVEKAARINRVDGSAIKPNSKTEACSREILFDFTAEGDCGFAAADHTAYLEMRADEEPGEPVLCAVLNRSHGDAAMGVSRTGIDAGVLRQADYLAVTYRADLSGTRGTLMLRLTGGRDGEMLYESSSSAVTGEWVTAYFDVSDYTAALRGDEVTLHLWVKGESHDVPEGEQALSLRGVELLCPKSYAWIWVLVSLIVVGAVLVSGRIILRRIRRRRYR